MPTSSSRPARKAVIPVAGMGTRFLPATKAVPKELLPVVDRPALQYIVEEAARAGLAEVLMVTGRNKAAIEDFFDRTPELETALEKKGDAGRLAAVQESTDVAQVHFVRQGEARGLGHAVLQAAAFVGDEPFAVLRETAPGRGGEIQLTDALATLVEREHPLHGVVFDGRRYDTGDKLDYLKAVIRLASEREDLGPALRSWLTEFVADLPAEGASQA